MILKRMRGEPSSLSAALSQASRSSSVTGSIPSATYEDVKRRLVMGMNTTTQLTMEMPTQSPARPAPTTLPVPTPAAAKKPASSSTAGMSAIRRVTAGLTASSKPAALKAAAAKAAATSEAKAKKVKASTTASGRSTGNKRKRTRNRGGDDEDEDDDDDGDDDSSSLSSLTEQSESEAGASSGATPAAAPTMTKSGRQVQKPEAYNPAAMDAASKRRAHYGKRTAEQALCRKCTRMHSPADNQMVFCDGCNEGWHQLCHEPWIHDDVVRDHARGWFCAACQAKRERKQQQQQHNHSSANKKQKLDHHHGRTPAPARESWASRTPQQKRAYLLTLPQQELVALLMTCLELHPDLPIFPATPRSLFAGTTTEGLFPRADANPTAPINYVRKISSASTSNNSTSSSSSSNSGSIGSSGNSSSSSSSSSGTRSATGAKGRSATAATAATTAGGGGGGGGTGGGGKGQKESSQERAAVEDEGFDPLAPLWPRAGMGLYRRLPPDTEDDERLVDDADFEAFSVIVYDDRGRKVEENGMKV